MGCGPPHVACCDGSRLPTGAVPVQFGPPIWRARASPRFQVDRFPHLIWSHTKFQTSNPVVRRSKDYGEHARTGIESFLQYAMHWELVTLRPDIRVRCTP